MIDVYWWSNKRSGGGDKENFGDYLVPYLLDKTTIQKYRWVAPNNDKILKFFNKKHYFVIGSILRKATKNTIVWGAGIIEENEKVENARFLAVRGPLTRKRLMDFGYQVPERYGDPAVLISLFNNKENTNDKKYIGIIPHFVDYQKVYQMYSDKKNFKVIDLLTNNPQQVLDEISKCKFTLSSSLHGIIVSHALNIPSLWMKVSDNLYGDDVKFFDYFLSVNIKYDNIIEYKNYSEYHIRDIFDENSKISMPKIENFNRLIFDLIETFPFRRSRLFKNAISSYKEQNV